MAAQEAYVEPVFLRGDPQAILHMKMTGRALIFDTALTDEQIKDFRGRSDEMFRGAVSAYGVPRGGHEIAGCEGFAP